MKNTNKLLAAIALASSGVANADITILPGISIPVDSPVNIQGVQNLPSVVPDNTLNIANAFVDQRSTSGNVVADTAIIDLQAALADMSPGDVVVVGGNVARNGVFYEDDNATLPNLVRSSGDYIISIGEAIDLDDRMGIVGKSVSATGQLTKDLGQQSSSAVQPTTDDVGDTLIEAGESFSQSPGEPLRFVGRTLIETGNEYLGDWGTAPEVLLVTGGALETSADAMDQLRPEDVPANFDQLREVLGL